MSAKSKHSGLTLIEMIFACAIFMIFTGIIATTFSSTSRSYCQGKAKVQLQNSLRMLLDVMCADLRQCYDPTAITITPGPTRGHTIRIKKEDYRKQLLVTVEYAFDSSTGTITRTDYDVTTGGFLSSTELGENITQLTFTFDAAAGEITIQISGNNPAYPGVGIINLLTAVTLRAGNGLLAVKALGKEEKSGISNLMTTAP